MAIEIEKKYRLTESNREYVERRLQEVGVKPDRQESEENTLYSSASLDPQRFVLRLRRTGNGATLAFKQRFQSSAETKHHREEESAVEDPAAVDAILQGIGFRPSLVYEKRRTTWQVFDVELVLDELPFGLFMEIEGSEEAIEAAEEALGLAGFEVEHASYPQLTRLFGTPSEGRTEARFKAEE
jgi:adenylate cyclase class 2